jgi:hypothetical protein
VGNVYCRMAEHGKIEAVKALRPELA